MGKLKAEMEFAVRTAWAAGCAFASRLKCTTVSGQAERLVIGKPDMEVLALSRCAWQGQRSARR
jgi:hypothetical protein